MNRAHRWIAVVMITLLASACGRAGPVAGGTPSPPAASSPKSSTPAARTTSPAPPRSTRIATGYVPLWPFIDQNEARAWQFAYQSGGHQPWHLDAGQTALAFTQGYLGFHGVDRVVSKAVQWEHARVAVGFVSPESERPLIAAVIHLIRYGTGENAPWEVVGTDDTTFSLTNPRYGSSAVSPLRVGGLITGVDESIRVEVRQRWSDAPVGAAGPVPAGGSAEPWSVMVDLNTVAGQPITVVAFTGGHIADVERFAITGIDPAAAP
ncbi:hypothetical protein J5X84_43715 [Streptosporangiaceae bacterium NEAU-GS5]|nr:hypothetical protein [Streptosporangiaceae bacterium NEAU-GS5]